MKKSAYLRERPRRLLKKLLFMKLCLALVLVTASHVAAHTGFGQEAVSLQMENARLSTVLKTIQNKTSYRFVFSNKLVDNIGLVNIKVQNTPVLTLLPRILTGTSLEFQQMNNTLIVIRERADIKKNILVKGVVTNQKGEPVSGATVSSNKGKATITNDKGEYSIEVDEYDELTFSYVGYTSQVIKVNSRQSINIVFEEADRAMEEVVVTALGIKRQEKALGYATQKVGGAALETVKGVDVGTSLTGMVSGLTVKNSTEFNARPALEMRGETPLLVIDGVPYGNMTLRDIPTDDIESIDMLKGPTAAALYGNRGANGAVMITTKKGKGKGLSIDINSNNMMAAGFIAIPKIQTSYGHGLNGRLDDDYVWGPKLDIGKDTMQWNPVTKQLEEMPLVSSGKDNLQSFMQAGIISNNNISVTQSGDNGFFRAGLNYIYNKGQWPNATLKIINYTMTGQLKIGDKFDLESHMGYTRQTAPQVWGQGYGPQGYLYQILMWTGPDYDIRQYRDYWVTPDQKQNWLYNAWYDNPYLIAHEKLQGIDNNKINASLTANYKFTKNLKLMFRTGYDYYKNELTVRNPAGINSTRGSSIGKFKPDVDGSPSGSFSWDWNAAGLFGQDETWGFSTNNDLILTYNTKIGKFGIDALAGGSIYYFIDKELGAKTANGLNVPGWYSLANATPSTAAGVNSISNSYSTWQSQVNSIYGKVTFSYGNGVFVDVTGRNDWSSTQQVSERSYFYPSVASSVILSEYIPMPQWVSMWKVRGSWTLDKKPAGIYSNNLTYTPGSSFGMLTSSSPNNLLGDNLKPSAARTWEIGTAAYFFKSRLHVDVAYFDKYYYNQQVSVPISNSSGFSSVLKNTEETYSRRGLEITVDGTVIRNRNFTWSSLINYSYNHRYYVKLDPVYSADNLWTKVGTRLDAYTAADWTRDPGGNIVNVGGKPQRNPFSSQIGYGDPDFSFGFINNFSFGNFIFGLNIDGRIGGLMYDYIWDKMFDTGTNPETDNQYRYNQVVNGDNSFVAPGVKIESGTVSYDKYGNVISDTRKFVTNDVPIGYQAYARSLNSTIHGVMSESFVKLRQLSIGYNIPASVLKYTGGIKTASVSITGQNLLLITKFKFSDPDVDTENLNAPSQRMVGVNIKLGL
jgi:TonB-linked SusC/RagA family outer membrane protein